jgi:hypothetical protein
VQPLPCVPVWLLPRQGRAKRGALAVQGGWATEALPGAECPLFPVLLYRSDLVQTHRARPSPANLF